MFKKVFNKFRAHSLKKPRVNRECEICGVEYLDDGYHFSCPACTKRYVDSSLRRMTDEQYITWLLRLRGRIESGLKLVYWDDTTIGYKETYCSWGICNDDLEAWPTPDLWQHPPGLWEDRWQTHPRGEKVRHIQNDEHQRCPFDTREQPSSSGCFYTCALFRDRVSTEIAIGLVDECIQEVIGETTSA